MDEKPHDLKPRTKAFAVRVSRMFSKLPKTKSDTGDCLKEIEETGYWLELLVESGTVAPTQMAELMDETRQLNAILTTIAKRSKGDQI